VRFNYTNVIIFINLIFCPLIAIIMFNAAIYSNVYMCFKNFCYPFMTLLDQLHTLHSNLNVNNRYSKPITNEIEIVLQ
jgi:hypothetical protein